ncbi:hypothetical protein [uncultured Tateyamaria sp.]|uniref:hypothetical protein n=1 Tax=uncultured Tateyamaria sp. TaxID=455651 RepID=UPI00262591BD|nr:hypothetical protein [uncultured Tateyamaria sp.]
MRFQSQICSAAYLDLLRLLQDDAASDLRSTATRVTVKGRVFWYDKYRVGTEMTLRYISPDSDALRERLAAAANRRAEQTHLVRICRGHHAGAELGASDQRQFGPHAACGGGTGGLIGVRPFVGQSCATKKPF